MTTRRGITAVWLSVWLAFGAAREATAYQIYGIELGGKVVSLKWKTPVRYFVTAGGVTGVTTADLQATVGRAFQTWQAVASASALSQFVGVTTAPPGDDDGISTLGFEFRPDLDRVLGATDYVIDKVTGEIIEADIFFNSAFPWSVAAGGEAGRYDLESIALHEIGHFFGLGHSALGETDLLPSGGRRVIAAETVMFPIAYSPGNISDRALKADDIAGISELYPAGTHLEETGSIVGKVTKNGQGVYGAHVVVFNPATGALVGGLTLNQEGQFAISGLSPGPYVIRVEPLDDVSLDSFFDDTSAVDLAFQIAYLRRLAVAPAGGASSSVVVAVTPK
jgi:hypothetical protein